MKQTNDLTTGWVLIVQNSGLYTYQIFDGDPPPGRPPRIRILRWLIQNAASAIGNTLYREFFR